MPDFEKVTDARGRVIAVRKPSQLMLARAVDWSKEGPQSMTANLFITAASVVAIDDAPMTKPKNAAEIEFVLDILGDDGLAAVQKGLGTILGVDLDAVESAKN